MTNQEILKIAMTQSAIESNCNVSDFLSNENKVVLSIMNDDARKYLKLPFYCDFTSYGNNIVASVNEDIYKFINKYLNKYLIEHCFETPNMQILNEELKRHGMCVCFMAEYFLPDINEIKNFDCKFETKIMYPTDFADYYLPQWSNALSENKKHLDKMAIGAYDNGKLIGLAACCADCDTMWQMGVDVLPEYRRKGIAASLTSKLAIEILKQNIVPFYCTSWANIKSIKNVIKIGFRPAWVQMTAKSIEFVAEINK